MYTARRLTTGFLCATVTALTLVGTPASAHAEDAAERPQGEVQDCLDCHRKLDPGMVRAWEISVHAQKTVGCAECHGTDHSAIFNAKGEVSAATCGGCHAVEFDDFKKSKHSLAWVHMEENAMFKAQSADVAKQTCMRCHAIGKRYDDGSYGKCNYCHTGHAFLAAEARSPDACHTCHMGPNHPQQEAYDSSKHGILWKQVKDTAIAPTCATCHMPKGLHDTGANLTLGTTIHGAVMQGDPKLFDNTPVLTQEEFDVRRTRMLDVCVQCHSSRFAREDLLSADGVKREADALVAEARAIIEDLAAEGLIELSPEDRRPNPVLGHTMVLGPNQLYEDTTPIEQRFFEMLEFHHANTFKGAYHNAPDVAHWTGIVPLKGALTDIRGEARRLREQARLRAASGVQPTPPLEQYPGAMD